MNDEKMMGDTNYIQKPINAGLGYNVKLINNIPKCDNEDWIIQPFLKDCDSKYSQHYRIITMYNKLYIIYKFTSTNIKKIASNYAQGATTELMYFKKEVKNLDKNIYDIFNKSLDLHKKEFSKCFSIGWDVILHCDKFNNKIPYVLEGNFMHVVWSNLDKEITDDYKKECLLFLKIIIILSKNIFIIF